MNKTIKIKEQVQEELERIKVDPTQRVDLSDFDDLENTQEKKKGK